MIVHLKTQNAVEPIPVDIRALKDSKLYLYIEMKQKDTCIEFIWIFINIYLSGISYQLLPLTSMPPTPLEQFLIFYRYLTPSNPKRIASLNYTIDAAGTTMLTLGILNCLTTSIRKVLWAPPPVHTTYIISLLSLSLHKTLI